MGLFEFIIGMTLICTIGGIITTGMQTGKSRSARAIEAENHDLRVLVGDMSSEMGKLRERVRVLERLATDSDCNLASEIERLRLAESSIGV